MVSELSTSSVIVFPVRVFTKICMAGEKGKEKRKSHTQKAKI
jgi:hypothetical protein